MKFIPLTLEGALAVLPLRNAHPEQFRTGRPINELDQRAWWQRVTARCSDAYWWEFAADSLPNTAPEVLPGGYAGIEHIDWIARTGEMSLLVDGGDEYWRDAFNILFSKAFSELNLREVHAEVYHCSPDFERWMTVAGEYKVEPVTLPMRKYNGGQHWDAEYLSWRLPS